MKIKYIALSEIKSHPLNPRPKLKKADTADLTASIKQVGLLDPITVMQNGDSGYHILSGHRRLHAHAQLKRLDIPCHVIEPDETDTDPLAVLVSANATIDLPDPVREAKVVAQLYEDQGNLVLVAAMLGKSATWVGQRMALAKLIPEWQEAVTNPEDQLYETPISFLIQIAKVTEDSQKTLLIRYGEEGYGFEGLDELKGTVSKMLRSLSSTPWSLKAANIFGEDLVPCTECPTHSMSTPGLFSVETPKSIDKALCRNATCFEHKGELALEEQILWAQKQNPEARFKFKSKQYDDNSGLRYEWTADISNRLELVPVPYHWSKSKKSVKGSIAVYTVAPEGIGRAVYMLPDEKVKQLDTTAGPVTATGKAREKGEDGKLKPLSYKEKLEGLKKRRLILAVKLFCDMLNGYDEHERNNDPADNIKLPKANAPKLSVCVTAATTLGCSATHYEKSEGLSVQQTSVEVSKALHLDLWLGVRGYIAKKLSPVGTLTLAAIEGTWKQCENYAKEMSVNSADIFKSAKHAIPEPKSWVKDIK